MSLAHASRLISIITHHFKVSFILSQVSLVHIFFLISSGVEDVSDRVSSTHEVRMVSVHVAVLDFDEALDHGVGGL